MLNGESLDEHIDLTSGLAASGVEVVFRGIEELSIDVGPQGVRVRETVDGRDLAGFGLVQVVSYRRPTATLLNAVADYLAVKGVRAVNIGDVGAPTRLFKYVRLANRGLSVPATVYLPAHMLQDAFRDLAVRLDVPFVLKTVTGGSSGRTSLVATEAAFTHELRARGDARGLLAQELVPPDGSYFVLVLGGRVSFVARQDGVGGGDLLATPRWDDAVLVDPQELDPAARETAAQAAASLGYDIAGVHLVRHWTTGKWCVLDVSSNPPIGSGGHTADKVGAYVAYVKRQLAESDQAAAGNLSDTDVTRVRLE
ncbi:hypothetical protein ACH4GE_36935 [Streptomyces tendae]|uniref:hypothetical protein n=1 Tax=Streptomyces tendae TaxID=1932 RepID=UPI00379A883E